MNVRGVKVKISLRTEPRNREINPVLPQLLARQAVYSRKTELTNIIASIPHPGLFFHQVAKSKYLYVGHMLD